MIPAQPGVFATYDSDVPRPVLAWDDAGRALVAPYSTSDRLVPAGEIVGFTGIDVNADPAGSVQLIPGGGWSVTYTHGEFTGTETVVAWVLRRDGSIMPAIDGGGYVETLNDGDYEYRLHPPVASLNDVVAALHDIADGGAA